MGGITLASPIFLSTVYDFQRCKAATTDVSPHLCELQISIVIGHMVKHVSHGNHHWWVGRLLLILILIVVILILWLLETADEWRDGMGKKKQTHILVPCCNCLMYLCMLTCRP